MTLEAGGDGTLLTDIPSGIGPVLGKFIPFFVYLKQAILKFSCFTCNSELSDRLTFLKPNLFHKKSKVPSQM